MIRRALGCAALVLITAALPSHAARPGALHFADLSGDANGLNSQGAGLPVPQTSTAPASIAGADIVSVDVTTRYKVAGKKKTPRGIRVTMHLAGPVMTGVNYLLTADVSSSCDGGGGKTIQLGYQDLGPRKLVVAVCQAENTGESGVNVGGLYQVSADTIAWDIDPILKPGNTMSTFYASSSVFVVGVFDEAFSSGTFTYAR